MATNIAWLMNRVGVDSYDALHAWSAANRADYWTLAVERLGIRFRQPYREMLDLSAGVKSPRWLVGARFNIVESCFAADPGSPAIIHQAEGGPLRTMTVAELAALSQSVAASLTAKWQPHLSRQRFVAIVMPMTAEAVAIYPRHPRPARSPIGIADSFRPPEIATRLRLAKVALVFTQDVQIRGGKTHPLYPDRRRCRAR